MTYNVMLEYQKIAKRENKKEKQEFFKKFDSNEFFLEISAYETVPNVSQVSLKHNLKFPMIYSEEAITKAFETGLINEDRLVVEYYLIAIYILKKASKKQYIVEFADTLLKKKKKLAGILNILKHPALQEKISFRITYNAFLKNKEVIYDLMREGYRIAIIIDESFEVNYTNLEKLNAFSYIIINRKLKHYNEIMQDKIVLNNILEV